MKAMVLQDKKKIVVTTEINSLPVLKRTDEEPDCSVESTSCSVESSPSFLESWSIKVEQTVNVLLLVRVF